MPTSRLDTGFRAAARIANPRGVKRKKRITRIKTANVTAIIPTSCDDIYLVPYHAPDGNGLGKLLIVQLEIHPARLLRMSSSPMNMITIALELADYAYLIETGVHCEAESRPIGKAGIDHRPGHVG